jgi:hypothetical protein
MAAGAMTAGLQFEPDRLDRVRRLEDKSTLRHVLAGDAPRAATEASDHAARLIAKPLPSEAAQGGTNPC